MKLSGKLTSSSRRNCTGLTMVEILVTLGITAAVVLPLGLIFMQSFTTVQHSKAESVSIFIAENVHSRLLTDPSWPPGSEQESFDRETDEFGIPTDTFTYDQLYFDGEGSELTEESIRAVYQGILTFSRSPNYESTRLDYIAFEVKRLNNPDAPAITYSFQRARRTPRELPN